jgi:hypothetical protein
MTQYVGFRTEADADRHIGKPPESVNGEMEELGFIYGAG